MKLCMSFINDLLHAEVLEKQNATDRWDDFDLESWEPFRPGMKFRAGRLIIGTAESLQSGRIPPDAAILCAGPAPDIEADRLLAVAVSYEELTDRVDNIFRSFETFEQRINDAVSTRQKGGLPELIKKLLAGQYVPGKNIASELEAAKWSLDGPFLCVCIRPLDSVEDRTISPYYSKLIRGEIEGTCVVEEDNRIVCVADLGSYDNSSEVFMQKNIGFLRDNIFKAGFSNEFRDLSAVSAYYTQARIALKTGVAAAPSIWYHRFGDRVRDYLLKQCTAELEAEYVCAPELLRLRAIDAENDTDYFNTLKNFLKNNMNVVRTAQEMYIHRGTMNYRVARIKELTGLDLEDPEVRFFLELSFRLLEL